MEGKVDGRWPINTRGQHRRGYARGLAAIERLRVDRPAFSSPASTASDRAETIALIRNGVKPFQREPFYLALASIGSWTRASEGTRDRAVRFLQPAKQVFRELADAAANEAASATRRTLALLSRRRHNHPVR